MQIIIHKDSHTDHLEPEALAWLLDVALRSGAYALGYEDAPHVVVQTFTLPERFEPLPCNLHGPEAGTEPVHGSETVYAARPGRAWLSRLVRRPAHPTRQVTIVTGPHDGEPLVLFTAYGGPVAPRELGDPNLPTEGAERARAERFWAVHALSAP